MTSQDQRQAAAQLRQLIQDAVGRRVTWELSDGREFTAELPTGLTYKVRVSEKTGINVIIGNGASESYIDTVTGGDLSKWGEADEAPVIDAVNRLRTIWDGGGLPGETRFGPIVAAVGVTGTRYGLRAPLDE